MITQEIGKYAILLIKYALIFVLSIFVMNEKLGEHNQLAVSQLTINIYTDRQNIK